jgi:hypothetical protein
MTKQKKKRRKPKKRIDPKVEARRRVENRLKDLAGNARVIANLMQTKGVRGNVKDFVVIAGFRIMDFQGSFDIRKEDDLTTVGIDGIRLVHKRELHGIVGEELASNFWDRRIRRRRLIPGKGKPNV